MLLPVVILMHKTCNAYNCWISYPDPTCEFEMYRLLGRGRSGYETNGPIVRSGTVSKYIC